MAIHTQFIGIYFVLLFFSGSYISLYLYGFFYGKQRIITFVFRKLKSDAIM